MPVDLRLAIIIPAYNAASHLPAVSNAAVRAEGDTEVLVVDAGSTDATAEIARELGARVLSLPERAGPAYARNAGVEAVAAEVVLFLDADCVPPADAVERVRAVFAANPEVVSLTGSYDSQSPDDGFFSQYMNLRHHFTHQIARQDGATFWAGCGAVRRSTFLAVGGFDADRYPRPQIEDVELGLRLASAGRCRLDPDLQVSHLKRWTLRSVVATELFSRALPWSRLILERGEWPDDLNLRKGQRLAAALAPLALLAVPAAAGAGIAMAMLGASTTALIALAVALVSIGLSLASSAGLVRCFLRRRGPIFAVGAWLFHQVHLTYSAAAFAFSWQRHRLRW